MDGRAPLPTIFLVLVVAAAAWFLVDTLSDESPPVAPVPDADDSRNSTRAESADGAVPPAPAPLESAPPPEDRPAPPDSKPAEPEPAERTGPKPPEMFTIESARWDDVPAIKVLEDVVGRTGHVLRASDGVRKILKDVKVTLTVKNEKAHIVVAKVIRGHDLDFTTRGNELRIFVDDD